MLKNRLYHLIKKSPNNTQPRSKMMPAHSCVGIELEVEGIDYRPEMKWWNIIHDGSLRNDGAEFVSKPVAGVNIVKAINELCDVLKRNPRAEVNLRTSLHVHLDCLDVRVSQLSNIIATSLVFEEALLELCTDVRSNNSFCLTSRQAYSNIHQVGALLSQRNNNSFREALQCMSPDRSKYSAINYANLSTLGTIEYRMHQGTLDKYELVRWVRTILNIKRVALSYQTAVDIMDAKRLQGACDAFLGGIKGMYKHVPQQRLEKLLERGVETANDALFLGGFYETVDVPVQNGQQVGQGTVNVPPSEESEDVFQWVSSPQAQAAGELGSQPRPAPSVPQPATISWGSIRQTRHAEELAGRARPNIVLDDEL